MSRCFPFPPPGYEKKARTDDVDLLKKEKHKEKKHKKERKDKEKKENKEKKEKDRSDGKHKDKKDKKEKHKDKKKEKDRDKERDRSNNSEEKKFSGNPECQIAEKTLDEKKFPGKSEGHTGEKFIQKEKGKDKDRTGEKKLAGQFSDNNGEKISQNSHLADDFRDSRFVQDLDRRVRDEGAGARNELVDKVMGTDQKRDEGMVRLAAKTANILAEEKEKKKKSGDRELDVQGLREETRSAGSAMVQNLAETVKTRVEGIPRQLESNMERRAGGKEKTKKDSDDKSKDKHKEKDREKKSHGKDKERDKEKEKAKTKEENRNLEQDNLKGCNKYVPLGTINLKTSQPFKDAVAEDNHRKRKDLEKNGFLHVNDIKPNKLPRNSSHPLTDNGKTLESQAPISLTPDSQGAGGISLKVDTKESKANGIIEAQLLSGSPTKHLSASAQASKREEMPMKPPHPDTKYLSQVLTVPKMEEWSDFDDQSWLFHSNESQSKKPKVGSSEIDEAPLVWAEALQIESADVCALPYVIPY